MMKTTYKIEGMHCSSCAMLIEGELEDIGVNATVNYQKETLTVEYDESKVTENTVKKAVEKAGYNVA
jgi:copper chaperone